MPECVWITGWLQCGGWVRACARWIRSLAAEHEWRIPSDATITRDVECMLNCYCRPSTRQSNVIVEDLLFCPLADLSLIQSLPEQPTYRLLAGYQPDLPDALVAFAAYEMLRLANRQTISFSDLAYAPRSPGRVFRLDEDALLARLQRIHEITGGQAYYSDQAGIRQIAWSNLNDETTRDNLLARAFTGEMHYV